MPTQGQLAFLLVGDHLGQVKKILPENGEIILLEGCSAPSSSNSTVSIEPTGAHSSKQLIANQNGDLRLYDCIRDKVKACNKVEGNLLKALPIFETAPQKKNPKAVLVYSKQMVVDGSGELASIKPKRSEIKNAQLRGARAACVGVDIPLRIFDLETRSQVFDAEPPEKNWLGVKPEVVVAGLDFVDEHRAATCSRSDSTVRVYDIRSKPKPIIAATIDQTAFNEHAESSRFICVASDAGNRIVVGSNVGQILALDLRFNAAKQVPLKRGKKLAPRTHKLLGSFKGARGASIKDLKIVPAYKADDDVPRVVSCCLDRYLRIHNFTQTNRYLDKHVYLNTKPTCCSPILYEDS